MDFIIIIGVGLILYAFYKWATLKNDYFIPKGVKFLKPTFLVGNAGKFFAQQITLDKFLIDSYNAFPNEKLFGAFDFRNPFFFLRDPKIVKQLTVKDFDHFENHNVTIDEKTDDLFGNSLIMLRGEKWRDMRATLSPAFTGSKMRQMFELVGDCAANMSEHFKQKIIETGELIQPEMKELFSRYTIDVIASAAYGIKVDSFDNEKNDFFLNGKKIMNFGRPTVIAKLIMTRICPKILEIFNLQLIDYDLRTFFTKMVMDTISIRNRDHIYRPDLINLLMNVRNGTTKNAETSKATSNDEDIIVNDSFATVEESNIGKTHQVKREWNDVEIVAQCFVFFLGGFDTNATVLSFTTYLLAVNQDCQEKLYQEILKTHEKLAAARGDTKLTYDDLQKMKYLDQIISESLRMWPPAMFTDRVCVKDYEYNDGNNKFIIEKGIGLWIPIYAFHHDPNFFPNPSKFDPERFSDENKHMIQSGTYIPFGVGPRNCIGSRFALMVIKSLIYHLLLNFKIEPNEKTQIPLRLKPNPAALVTEKGIHLSLNLRTSNN